MSTVSGRYHDGKVILDAPVDWPDGAVVRVSPKSEKIGMTEDEWPTTPEGIQQLIEKMWSFEPVELTPEEEAEWMAAREAVKKYTIEKMEQQENPFE
jgi:hypothetical protein